MEKPKLRVFMDASQNAYRKCAYIINVKESTLIMSKNRVAPLKHIMLPQLELKGAAF